MANEFGTFDLGRIIQTAETIKGMKRQAETDRLRDMYLGEQIQGAQQSRQLAQNQEQRQATQFGQEQQIANTKLLNAASAEIMQNPAAVERWLPQLRQAGVFPPGDDNAWRQVPPEQIQAKAREYFESTSAALAALRGPQEAGDIGKYNPGDYTPDSFAKFLRSKNPSDLSRYVTPAQPAVVTIGNVPSLVDKNRRTVIPLSTEQSEQTAAREKAGVTATGKAESERFASYVDEGVRAADGLPIINRALQLLDSVKTGGINAAQLAATNFLGVTGADEAELSNNLGKAVLSQLRATFGAQFTEREGARLDALEAGFGKSTEGNKRILQQVKQLVERSARRGLDAARRTGDEFSAEEIQRSMGMSLGTQGGSGGQQGASSPPVRVNTPEEAMRLPPGTVFITPDGRQKVR